MKARPKPINDITSLRAALGRGDLVQCRYIGRKTWCASILKGDELDSMLAYYLTQFEYRATAKARQ